MVMEPVAPSQFHLTPWAPPGGDGVIVKAQTDFRQYLTPSALRAPIFATPSRNANAGISLPRRHSVSDASLLRKSKTGGDNEGHFLPPATPGAGKIRQPPHQLGTHAARPLSLPNISRLRSMTHHKRIPDQYKCKYDHEMVIMLRDFYEELVSSNSIDLTKAPANQNSGYDHLDQNARKALLNALGKGTITFKKILSTMYPLANARDVTAMIAYAYPPQKVVEVKELELAPEQRMELVAVFEMFDIDKSGNISFQEFMEAVKHLKIPREEAKFMMSAMDADGDGCVSIDEFVRWLGPIYFSS